MRPMYELLLPLTGFAAVTIVTPGPNNVLLTASGLNFGFRRTLPHMLGVSLGFPAMVLLVGLGLAGLFTTSTVLHHILKILGTAYLAYLAFRIATATPVLAEAETRARPMRFWEAVAFQWVNLKAWVIAVGAVTGYTTLKGNTIVEILLITAIFLLISFPCTALWAGFGVVVKRFLSDRRHVRAFNIVMALLLLASIAPLVTE
jgi:threonine/homoserine/homoserine lactone efflux protein